MELPMDILQEILSKLPIKTIITFRCVCKAFKDLISSTIPNNQMTNLIIQFNDQTTKHPKDNVHLIDAQIDLTDEYLLRVSRRPIYTIPNLETSKLNKYAIVNACNGLIYFAVKSYSAQCSYICNPITKEVVRFSKIDSTLAWTLSLWLGFSPLTTKYKFLRFAKFRNGPKPQVLEIGSNHWKDIHWSKPFVHITTIKWDYTYTSVNGIGYWLCPYHKKEFIVYFDFESETLGTIDAPPGFDEHRVIFRDRMGIGAVGDSLCLVDNIGNQHLDIWMMTNNERGDWVKKFSCQEKPKMFYGLLLRPLQVMSNGDILMVLDNRNIVLYDVKRNSFRLIKMHMAESGFNIVSFVPSFFAIKDILKGISIN